MTALRTAVAQTGSTRHDRVLPAQQGMILNNMRFPDDGVDVLQITLDWTAPLQPEPFEAAWRSAARRHPVLRTAFRLDDSLGLVQVLDPAASIDIRWRDLPAQPATGPDQPFESFLRADRRDPFDQHRPQVRLTVVRRAWPGGGSAAGAPAHRAVLTFHHALLDGRSMRLLVEDVSAVYAAFLDGRVAPDSPRPAFSEFVRWWQAADPAASEQFWTGYLAGAVLPRPLPGYLGPPVAGAAEPMKAETVLSRTDSDLIRRAAQAAGLSSSTFVTAAWALLRARYGGVRDVVLAVTRSCRRDSIPGADDIIGLLVNTVPLRVRINADWSVRELLTAVSDGIREIRQHQRTPTGSILTWAGLPADTTLMDSLVMFDRQQLQTGLPAGIGTPSAARVDRLPSYPLAVCAYDEPQIHLSVIWDGHRFAAGSAQRMLEQLRATMIELASTPLAPLAGLDLGRAAEAGLLAGWNTTPASYPADATIPALFAARVASHPEAPALAFGTTSMSYAELDRRSNALAWLLRRRGVGTDQPVGVALGRGIDLIVALLAVLKAGGAYLPVDAGNPASRIAAMIDAAGASLVLVTAETATAMPELAGVQLIHLDREPIPAAGGQVPPPDIAHPLGLAYVSFTSGSTGAPKGVGIPHRAVIRLISSPTFASLGRGQRLLHMAPAAFDASTLEIWGGLLTGGTVVIAPPGPLGLPDIAALLRDGGVTVAWLTAGLFHQLAEADINALAGVSVLLAGGDVLNPDTCRAVLAARGGKPLVNGYGPTENTTFISCHVMTDPAEVGTSVPVGRPIQHTTVHILDEDGQQVPIGVTGELYAGGEGVARGYAGNAAATARAFVPDPSGHGGRLYRTGDLARWRADGTLEFAGRADDQIKIRGFRVEPGEAAAALRAHPDVAESVVVVAGEGEQRHLIGYVTVADGAEPGALRPSLLREFVATRLPEYLVPTGFKAVASLPLNANGKVDRAALPAPDIETSGPVSAPRGATEQRLADLWRTLLPDDGAGRFGLGREDSFFSAGGNSLSAARLMFRINEVFNVELRLAEFYDAPTLTACAALIDAAQADAALASPGQAGAPLADAALAGVGQPDGARPADGVTTRAVRLRTAAAGIARRDRSAYLVTAQQPRPAAAAIGRRDRSAYLVTAQPPLPGRPAGLAPHLVRLGGDWALWRSTCLRAAGFPIHLLTALADQDLAAAADAVIAAGKAASASSGTAPAVPPALARAAASTELAADAGTVAGTGPAADPADLDQATAAYSAEFAAATRRLSAALYEAAGLPALREAITWQNRHALTTGIDVLRRRGPQPAKRNAKSRQHEALVASYLQRYCAKNDTIGFFGAVAWSQIDDGHGIRVTHPAAGNALAARVTYLEGWAVRAIMAGHAAALRQWLVPRLMPFVSVDGTLLRVPLAPPVQLTPAEAAVLRACDGNRDAGQVAAAVLADPAAGLADAEAVLELLARLADRHRLAWQVDVAPQDIRPEQSMRKLLSRVTDETARGPAEAALDELTAARDELAAAGGDAQQVAAAMAGLEETFTRLAGAPATRRAGELYAGRTLAYEECLRGGDVRLGADCLDGIRAALPLVFDAARWFTTACGACYARHFEEAYQQRSAALGTDAVPFADLWLMVNNALFDQPPQLIEPAVRAVRERWAELLDLPPGARQVQLRAADLVERVRAQFAAGPLPWPTAVHHSPDLMIAGRQAAAGGSLTWVLGEVHPSVITTRYASWIEFHDNPAAVRTALRHDLREPAVWFAESGEDGATSTRLSNVLDSPGDVRLIYAHDSCGYDSAASLVLGECDVLSSSAGLLVRRRDGTFERALLAVVGDLIGIAICHYFDLTPAGGHAPRITIDDLVVSRERWRLTAADLHFADTTDEDARYLQARRWAASHGLPRHVFVRYAGERKPIYADLTSLASVELISRSVRRCRRAAGPGAAVTVTEMLPTPDQAWLTDAQGLRYGAELRLVAADQRTADQAQEG